VHRHRRQVRHAAGELRDVRRSRAGRRDGSNAARELSAGDGVSGAFYLTLVPIRPRRRCERRSLRTFPGVSLRPGSLGLNTDTPRRLSTPLLTPLNSTATFARMDNYPQACGGSGQTFTPCGSCGGDGRVRRSKRISLRVPPGVDSGSRLRVRSEGNAGKKVRSRARVAARSRPLVFFDEWRALPITRSNDRLTRVSPRPINRHPSHRRAAPRATSTSSSP
jgi:hypothetical protein